MFRTSLNTVSQITSTYFALWVLAAAVVGIVRPQAFARVGPNIGLLLGIVMFGVGAMLKPDDLAEVLRLRLEVIGGVAAQFVIMAPLALALSTLFGLPAELTAGLILVGTAPGGTASNVVTLLARGDVALSISVTSASTLIAPLATPLLTLWMIGSAVPVDATGMLLSILEIVIVPVALGVVINGLFSSKVDAVRPLLPVVSILAIMVIVAFVIGANWPRFQAVGAALIAAVVAHNLLGLGLGYAVARLGGLSEPKRRAICLEVGMQNSGLAVALATLHFGPIAALPGALASVWHNISGPLLATYWRSRDPGAEA